MSHENPDQPNDLPQLPKAEAFIENTPELSGLPETDKQDVTENIALMMATVEDLVSDEKPSSTSYETRKLDMEDGTEKVIVADAHKTETGVESKVSCYDADELKRDADEFRRSIRRKRQKEQ